jgi:hypothetical protein
MVVSMRLLATFCFWIAAASLALAQGSVEYFPPPSAAPAKPNPSRTAVKPKTRPAATVQPAQARPPGAASVSPSAAKPTARAAAAARKPANAGLRDTYNAIPLAERIALQFDLTWTGDYIGLSNGEFSDRLVAAVRAFQKRRRGKETGLLSPEQRAALTASAKRLQNEVGWRLVEDAATGIHLGLPAKFATENAAIHGGNRWSSAQGQLQIETFRISNGATLEAVFEQQKKEPTGRRVSSSVLRPEFFVVSGTQGLKKFYVRAAANDGQVRGMTVLYDQAMEGSMDRVVIAMSSAFSPFGDEGNAVADRAPVRRKVEYGTGLVVSATGHILTDRQVIDGCHVTTIPGHGHAERVAETAELALLRIYGARNLTSLALLGTAATAGNVTLIGIADPQAQGAGAAVSSVAARLTTSGQQRILEPAPAFGFSGAAALDSQGRFIGMVAQKPPVVAGPGGTVQATLVPAESVVRFLEAQGVASSSGSSAADNAKAAVVRVICVRK